MRQKLITGGQADKVKTVYPSPSDLGYNYKNILLTTYECQFPFPFNEM